MLPINYVSKGDPIRAAETNLAEEHRRSAQIRGANRLGLSQSLTGTRMIAPAVVNDTLVIAETDWVRATATGWWWCDGVEAWVTQADEPQPKLPLRNVRVWASTPIRQLGGVSARWDSSSARWVAYGPLLEWDARLLWSTPGGEYGVCAQAWAWVAVRPGPCGAWVDTGITGSPTNRPAFERPNPYRCARQGDIVRLWPGHYDATTKLNFTFETPARCDLREPGYGGSGNQPCCPDVTVPSTVPWEGDTWVGGTFVGTASGTITQDSTPAAGCNRSWSFTDGDGEILRLCCGTSGVWSVSYFLPGTGWIPGTLSSVTCTPFCVQAATTWGSTVVVWRIGAGCP